MLYAPIAPMWVYYMLRSRAVWFFTPSNPKLTFGGMEGEPKNEMHVLLPDAMRPKYFNVRPGDSFVKISKELASQQISYPLIVKPEIGGQGILFRKIETPAQLQHYHANIPVEYFVQEMVHYPCEVSLFYYRHPTASRGTISGFLHKVPLHVIGDGQSTLRDLILKNSKASKHLEQLFSQHHHQLSTILQAGEKYMLSHAGNHNRGASFTDMKEFIDDELVTMLDRISVQNEFYYGRYDIMCESIETLKQGKNFKILEYNGCGAEPNHFYDTGYTLLQAWKEILKHWRMLYAISRHKYYDGIAYWPLLKGIRFLRATRKHYEIIKLADRNIP